MAIQSLAAKQLLRTSGQKKSASSSGLDLSDPQTRKDILDQLGVEEPKPQVDLFSRLTGLLDAFRPTDDINYAIETGDILGGIGGFLTDPIKKVATLVTGQDYDSADDKKGGKELLDKVDMSNMANADLIKGIGGFVLDVALDPTTYVTLGTSGAGKIAVGSGEKVLTKAGAKLFKKATTEATEQVAKLGAEELGKVLAKEGLEHLAGRTTKEIAEGLAKKEVMRYAERGVNVLKNDEAGKLAKQIMKQGVFDEGGFKFAGRRLFGLDENSRLYKAMNAYFNPVGAAGEAAGAASGKLRQAGKLGETYGKVVDTAKQGVGDLVKGTVDTVRNLFDPKYSLAGGNIDRFGGLVNAVRATDDFLTGQTEDVVRKFKTEYQDILSGFENPEILPFIIENTPEEKLMKLPEQIKKPLMDALEEMRPKDEVLEAARRALRPSTDTLVDALDDELKPFANIVANSETYDDALKQAPEMTEDMFSTIKRTQRRLDPSQPNLEELGSFKSIINKKGVKQQVFDGVFTEGQIKKLNARGIDTTEDLVKLAEDKAFNKSQIVERDIWETRAKPTVTRLMAGKEPEVKQISTKINDLKTSVAYTAAKSDYDQILKEARSTGYNRADDYIEEMIGREAATFDRTAAEKLAADNPSVKVYDQKLDALLDANDDIIDSYMNFKRTGSLPTEQADRIQILDREVERIRAERMTQIDELVVDPKKFYDDQMGKIQKWEKMKSRVERLDMQRSEKIDKIIQDSTVTEEVLSKKPYRELSQKQLIAEDLGMTTSQLDSSIKKAREMLTEAKKKSEKVEVLLDQVYRVSDPVQREIIDKQIARITQNTEDMLEVGAITESSKARYLGRKYTLTPGGKDLTQGADILQGIGGSMKSKLDPRAVTNQKARIYDYLADAISEGGETTIIKPGMTQKEVAAAFTEQLARDEVKAMAAREFKGLADQIINKQITDSVGNPLYSTAQDAIDQLISNDVKVSGKILEHLDNYKVTGKLSEPLKNFLAEKGYKQLTQKGGGVIPAFKDVFFDEEAHGVLTRIHNSFFGDQDFHKVIKVYDKVQNILKASQTSWFPAFHVRNAFSNIFTNAMSGMYDVRRYKDAIGIQRYSNALERLASATDDAARNEIKQAMTKLGEQTIELGKGQAVKISELYDLAKNNAVIGGGFYADLADEFMGSKISGIKSANPLSQNFILSQVGSKVGSMVEDNARIALFLDTMAKGSDIRSAALKVKEVLFDYGDLTDFEKNIMKRLVPYYTWTKKNAVLQMQRLVKQPGKYKAMIDGFTEIRDAMSNLTEEEKAKLPDWAKEGVGLMFKVGGDSVSAVTQFGLPHEAFAQLLNDNPLNQLGVPPKMAIELGTGQNIFKGKAILDDNDGRSFRNMPQFIKDRMGYREEVRKTKDGDEYTVYYVDPWAKYWVGTILGRTQSTFSKISTAGAEGDTAGDILNILSGVKKYDFNLTEEAEKRNREQQKDLLKTLVDRGYAREYTNQYIPKDVKNSLLDQMAIK